MHYGLTGLKNVAKERDSTDYMMTLRVAGMCKENHLSEINNAEEINGAKGTNAKHHECGRCKCYNKREVHTTMHTQH